MTPTQVFNLALDASGSRHTILNLTEESREAEVIGRWYPTVRDQVLRAAFWPSAQAFQRLGVLVAREDAPWVDTDPDPGAAFAYAAPSDMIAPRFLSDFTRFTLSRRPDNSVAIMTNSQEVILSYTMRQAHVDAWDSSLRMAIIYALAAHITSPLQGNTDRAQLNIGLANQLILDARVLNANVDENQFETLPPWIAARGYTGGTIPSRFFYPYGPMLALSEVTSVS